MRVSAEYAQEHFADIAGAADRGEAVEIVRVGKPRLLLVAERMAAIQPVTKRRLLGAAKGEVWLSGDWDSARTNQEIEDAFEGSNLFPKAASG